MRLPVELHDEMRTERMDGQVAQKSLLALVLAEGTRAATTAPSTSLQPSVMADALRYIERACLQPISLSDVARAVSRSPSHVTTALRQTTGKSVVD